MPIRKLLKISRLNIFKASFLYILMRLNHLNQGLPWKEINSHIKDTDSKLFGCFKNDSASFWRSGTLSSRGLGLSMPMLEMLFCRNCGHYFSFLPTDSFMLTLLTSSNIFNWSIASISWFMKLLLLNTSKQKDLKYPFRFHNTWYLIKTKNRLFMAPPSPISCEMSFYQRR